jgi:MYXO-CTERM domain-containing protein
VTPAETQAAGEPSTKNYQTKLQSIQPAVKGLTVTTEGGERYLVVKNSTGKVVSVAGYDNEQYLRFLPSGEVQVNANSPARYLNEIRFGTPESVTIPPSALASTRVKWEKVADNGSYRWFDHRIHWMEKQPPPIVRDESKRTKIFDWKVPAKVASTPVTVSGTLSWVPASSSSSDGLSTGAIIGLVGGALVLLAGVALFLRRRRRPVAGTPRSDKSAEEAW